MLLVVAMELWKMKRYHSWQTNFALVLLTGVFLGCPRAHPPQGPKEQATPGDTITRDNSPQFARDCDNIGSLHVTVGGDCAIDADGDLKWYEDSWCLKLRPQNADAAHSLLRDLLRDYPLSRSFRGTQTRFRTAQNACISFYQQTDGTEEDVFTIMIFSAAVDYMEIEHRTRVHGSGLALTAFGLGGTEVPLEGAVKAKLVSFLADCAATAKSRENSGTEKGDKSAL